MQEIKPRPSLLINYGLKSFSILLVFLVVGLLASLGMAVLDASKVIAIAAGLLAGFAAAGLLLARTSLQVSNGLVRIRNPLRTYDVAIGHLSQFVVQPISYRTNFVETDRSYRIVVLEQVNGRRNPTTIPALATERRTVKEVEEIMASVILALRPETA